MSYREQVKSPNEIWAEADGCLLIPDSYGKGWLAFGTSTIVTEDDPRMSKPLSMVFDGKKFIAKELVRIEGIINSM